MHASDLERSHQVIQQLRFFSAIVFTQRRPNRLHTNPVSRALIGHQSPPSSRPCTFSTIISSVCDCTRPGNHDHSSSAAKRALQCNLHIADDFDCATDNFNQHPLHQAGDAVVRRACN